jgi:hypothetical protein
MLKFIVGGLALTAAAGCGVTSSTDDQAVKHAGGSINNNVPMPNSTGNASTFNVNASNIDLTGPFFQSLGTNGRSCGSCHAPEDGWTVIPSHIQQRFDQTGGTDPIFRTNDGSVSPVADVSTVDARRTAYALLLSKGLIRVSNPVPATADFTLVADDPYNHASPADVSTFRRPLQSANLPFLSTVMWDGRETFAAGSSNVFGPAPGNHCLHAPFPTTKCFADLDFDLGDQANGATRGHAQATMNIALPIDQGIVQFEEGLYFGQMDAHGVGGLDVDGATGGPENIASNSPYFGQNDNFGDYNTGAPFTAKIFDTYDAWAGSNKTGQAAVARGQAIFNGRTFTIDNVGGLNGPHDALGLPSSFAGTCGTCHDTPNGGNHSIPAPLDIGLVNADQRTADLPLYHICRISNPSDCRDVSDPGRGLITGKFNDIGKFKGPTLRGIAARAPYFHNGSAADFAAVIDFYNNRFHANFTDQEKSDLAAFLATL